MHGIVRDLKTQKPIPNVTFDMWQASSNGKYDFQDPDNQSDNNLRGKFKTDENGEYRLYCLRPTAYSLPQDGPAYQLLQALDRHPMRPAHIHLMVTHPDYKEVVTQIYPKDDPWLSTDTVFAVKDDLVVDFAPLKGIPSSVKPHTGPGGEATKELELNLVLAPKGTSKQWVKALSETSADRSTHHFRYGCALGHEALSAVSVYKLLISDCIVSEIHKELADSFTDVDIQPQSGSWE